MRRRSWLISVVVLSASSIACTALLGDYSVSGANDGGTSGGPGGCTADQKSCNGNCVSKDDPVFGCATAGCEPCSATTNAAPACKAGICSFACNDGFSDCDGNPVTGCEANSASDVSNCGACGRVCGSANTATPTKCAAGKCNFACKQGFAHCSGMTVDTGCETDLSKDPQNCGACNHSCLGGMCTAGKCQPVQVASASNPSGVAVDATTVYFTLPTPSIIQRIQKDLKCTPAAPCPQDFVGSGAGDTMLLGSFRGPTAILSDGKTVWWTAQAAGVIGMRSATLTPGPSTSPITSFGPATSTQPGYMVLAGGKIWWTTGFANNVDPAPHVRSANLDGTNVTTFATYALPGNTSFGKGGIAADLTHVYWASEKWGLYRAALNDAPCVEGTSCTSFPSVSGPYGVAVDGAFVYWTEPANGTVKRAPKTGGQPIVIASNQPTPRGIAVIGTNVYWANNPGGGITGSIRRAPQVAAKCDADACEKIADVGAPDALIGAEQAVYWTDNVAAGGVYRFAD